MTDASYVDPIDPGSALQIAAVAALLASPDFVADVADRVVAEGLSLDQDQDVFPRCTIEPPQVLPAEFGCSDNSICHLTVHLWAAGADRSLVVGRMAGAARRALDVPLTLQGHRVSSQRFMGAHKGPSALPTAEHRMVLVRYNTQPLPPS